MCHAASSDLKWRNPIRSTVHERSWQDFAARCRDPCLHDRWLIDSRMNLTGLLLASLLVLLTSARPCPRPTSRWPARWLRADRVDDRAGAAARRRPRHHAGPRRLPVAGHDQRPGAVRRPPVFAVGSARRAGAAGAQRARARSARTTAACGLDSATPAASAGSVTGRLVHYSETRRPAARRDRRDDRGSPRHRLGGRRRRAVQIRRRSLGTDGRRGRPAGRRGFQLYEDQHGALWVGGGGGVYPPRRRRRSNWWTASATYRQEPRRRRHRRRLGDRPAPDRQEGSRSQRADASARRSPARRRMAPASRPRRIALGGFLGQRVAPHPQAGRQRRPRGRALRVRKQNRRRATVALRGHGRQHLGRDARRRAAARVRERAAERHRARRPDHRRRARAVGGRATAPSGWRPSTTCTVFPAARAGYTAFRQTLALHTDRSGAVWAATTQDVVRVVGDRMQPVGAAVRAAARQHRLDHHRHGRRSLAVPRQPAGRDALVRRTPQPLRGCAGGSRKPCSYTYTDRRGRVWVGFIAGGVAVYEDGRFRCTTRRTASSPAAWWQSPRTGRAPSG